MVQGVGVPVGSMAQGGGGGWMQPLGRIQIPGSGLHNPDLGHCRKLGLTTATELPTAYHGARGRSCPCPILSYCCLQLWIWMLCRPTGPAAPAQIRIGLDEK